jgi:hypothetical protein
MLSLSVMSRFRPDDTWIAISVAIVRTDESKGDFSRIFLTLRGEAQIAHNFMSFKSFFGAGDGGQLNITAKRCTLFFGP